MVRVQMGQEDGVDVLEVRVPLDGPRAPLPRSMTIFHWRSPSFAVSR